MEGETVCLVTQDSFFVFDEYPCHLNDVVLLYDPNKLNEADTNWKSLYMPVWSEAELSKVNTEIYQMNKDELHAKYMKWGGSPRNLFRFSDQCLQYTDLLKF